MSHPEPKLSSLYQEVILDHYKKPRNKGVLEDSTVQVHMLNPSCGDEVRLQLKIMDGAVQDAKFVGNGCSISQSSISMMTDLVKGKSIEEASALAARFTEMMRGDEDAARDRSLGNLRALAGVSKFPVRTKCALLGFNALGEAIERTAAASAEGDSTEPTPGS